MYRVYIAGPMSGIEDYNIPAFNLAAAKWRAQGWHVENPGEFGEHDDWTWMDYMVRDLPLLMRCDAIAMMPGWQKSKGAQLEKLVAEYLGFPVFMADKPVPDHEYLTGNKCCPNPPHAHAAALMAGKTWRDF